MEFDAPAELGWQALKYAARRLRESEQERFEEQLSSDQSAREAVAQAVELSHTVAALHAVFVDEEVPDRAAAPADGAPLPVARKSTLGSWSTSLAWLGLGIAASLAIAFTHPNWFAGEVHPQATPSSELIAASWADLNSAESESGRTMLTSFAIDPNLQDATASGDGSTAPEVGTDFLVVPDWIRLGLDDNGAKQ